MGALSKTTRWVVAVLAASSLTAVSTALSAAVGRTLPTLTCNPQVNLSHWTNARLAAQTVVVPSQADQVATTSRLVATGYGGILLFGTTGPSTLGSTVASLQASTPQHLGMFVMTDEEGGGVLRIENLVGQFPWARSMASTMSATQITALARRVGTQLLRAGVNMDLAPVLDVDGRNVEPGASDPDGYRSFSGSVPVVITDGNAFAKGLEEANVIPVVKHFPGLGDSTGNTDDGPARTLPWATLKASDLHTFEAAINRGISAIMVANASIPGLTSLPASISGSVITGVLRDWLGFKGLILTDSLTAGAISAAHLSVQAAAVDALRAGADLVLLGAQPSASQNVQLAISVANSISEALANGSLARSTVIGEVQTILATRGTDACTD